MFGMPNLKTRQILRSKLHFKTIVKTLFFTVIKNNHKEKEFTFKLVTIYFKVFFLFFARTIKMISAFLYIPFLMNFTLKLSAPQQQKQFISGLQIMKSERIS